MPAPGRCQRPGITERVDSHGLVTFGVEGEARLLHNRPIGATVADGPSKPSLHQLGGSAVLPHMWGRTGSARIIFVVVRHLASHHRSAVSPAGQAPPCRYRIR
jgi:hypothetical protein